MCDGCGQQLLGFAGFRRPVESGLLDLFQLRGFLLELPPRQQEEESLDCDIVHFYSHTWNTRVTKKTWRP